MAKLRSLGAKKLFIAFAMAGIVAIGFSLPASAVVISQNLIFTGPDGLGA